MTYSKIEALNRNPISEVAVDWQTHYMRSLHGKGWEFSRPNADSPLASYVSAQDQSTLSHLKEWKETNKPVELSIVVVPPNGDLGSLPIRTLGYAVSSLALAESLKNDGVTMDSLRIVNPSNLNVYCNGGNLDQQIKNAEAFRQLVNDVKDAYFPTLADMKVTNDTGLSIDKDKEDAMKPLTTHMVGKYPEIAHDLHRVSQKHNLNGTTNHELNDVERPMLYLAGHPEAWGYSETSRLFQQNGKTRLNFMPWSEARYMDRMMSVRDGEVWKASKDKQIGTLFASRHMYAPYYPLWGGEPTLNDLKTPDAILQLRVNTIRLSGGALDKSEITDVLHGMGMVHFRERTAPQGAPKIHQLVGRALAAAA